MKHDFYTKEYRATNLSEKWDDDKQCYRIMTQNESDENHYEEKRMARNKITYLNKKLKDYIEIEGESFRTRKLRKDLVIWEKYQKDVAVAGPKEYVPREWNP